jgi:LysM repeat protein
VPAASVQVAAHASVAPVFRPTPPQATLDVYVVRPGDSLLDIAERYATDVDALIALNRLSNPNVIVVGTSLKVPALTAAHLAEAHQPNPEP